MNASPFNNNTAIEVKDIEQKQTTVFFDNENKERYVLLKGKWRKVKENYFQNKAKYESKPNQL